MDRANKILKNSSYINYIEKIADWEKQRSYCHHDMSHFLDVARITMIINLEENLALPKELIYTTALLHDIGRFKQYEDGTPHEIASAELAKPILEDCGFDEMEIEIILDAISNHRNEKIAQEASLRGIFYRGDKQSRSCFWCKCEKQCDWKKSKKNLYLDR